MIVSRTIAGLWRILVVILSALGTAVIIGLMAIVLNLDTFGLRIADRVLANAIRPAGREMPTPSGSIPYSSADIQIVGGMGQGLNCSIPSLLEKHAFPSNGNNSPVGLRMRQACVYHDYCYRHGAATYGYTQANCDFLLQAQAFRICTFIESRQRPNEFDRVIDGPCLSEARLVTLGVRIGGSDSFRTLDARAVRAVGEAGNIETDRNSSTFFEFDAYPTDARSYTVYRVADAPPEAQATPTTKAIYQFQVRPSGITVSYSLGQQNYRHLFDIPGHPGYLTSAPFVVRAGQGENEADWFVWWQRDSEDTTGGRLVALAPRLATHTERTCFTMDVNCAATSQHIVVTHIGRAKPSDPQISRLEPAGFGPAAVRGISLAALRANSCRGAGGGNAPCYVHVGIRTDVRFRLDQPQEPLSIVDYFSPQPHRTDHNRYRNFASLPYVLAPPDSTTPVLAWTRRDQHYQSEAHLRRAAVDPGIRADVTADDTAVSMGSIFLRDFAETDEPGFVLGRSSTVARLASLVDDRSMPGANVVALRTWPLPPAAPTKADPAPLATSVADDRRCQPGLEADWLQRPPQIQTRRDGSALAVFSRLRPHVTRDWTVAQVQLATILIQADGSCHAPARRWADTTIKMEPTGAQEAAASLESGREGFVRLSRAPLLLVDLAGDGLTAAFLPEGRGLNAPLLLCTIAEDGTCATPQTF